MNGKRFKDATCLACAIKSGFPEFSKKLLGIMQSD
jgi:hypothetical protein